MDWIKENKFAAALIGVTSVLVLLLTYVIFGNSSKFDEVSASIEKEKSAIKALKSSAIYPSKKNLDEEKVKVRDYTASAIALQKQLMVFRPDNMPLDNPAGFANRLSKYRGSLEAKFKEKGVDVPAETMFGFNRYTSTPIVKEATPVLGYQMEALKWLLSTLADTKPKQFLNIYRAPQPEEDPVSATPKKTPSKKPKKGGKAKSKASAAPAQSSVKPVRRMPIELTFRGTEEQFASFYGRVVNSQDYFFEVLGLRIQNQKVTPPTEAEASMPKAAGFGGLGGDFEIEGDDASKDDESENDRVILKQVLGAEPITVHMSLSLVLFADPEEVKLGAK